MSYHGMTDAELRGLFHPEMKCSVGEIRYDFRQRAGFALCFGCVDMSGAIGFFKRIDPHVRTIHSFMDRSPRDTEPAHVEVNGIRYYADTNYYRHGDTWSSVHLGSPHAPRGYSGEPPTEDDLAPLEQFIEAHQPARLADEKET